MKNPNRIVDIYQGNWHLIIEWIPEKNLYGLYEHVYNEGRWTVYPVHISYDKSLENIKRSACSAFWDVLGVKFEEVG